MGFDKSSYDQRYHHEHLTKKLIAFNRDKPGDMAILEFAEKQGNFTAYVKYLIRKEMEARK